MISEVTLENYKGITGKFDLGRLSLLHGRNGAGKSAIIEAALLTVCGSVPGLDKKNQAVIEMASKNVLRVGVRVTAGEHDPVRISRMFTLKKGKVSQAAEINGTSIKPDGIGASLTMIGIDPDRYIIDMGSFWDLSPNAKRKKMLFAVGGAESVEEAIKQAAEEKEKLNEIRARIKASRESIKSLVEELAGREATTDPIEILKAKKADLQTKYDELHTEVATGANNDAVRKTLNGKIAAKEQTQAKIKELEATIKELNGKQKTLFSRIQKIKHEQEGLFALELPEAAADVLKELSSEATDIRKLLPSMKDYWRGARLDEVDTCVAFDTMVDHLTEKIVQMYPGEETVKDRKAYIANVKKDLTSTEFEGQRVTKQLNSAKQDLAKLRERLKGIADAEKQIDKVGAGVDPAIDKACAGVQTQIADIDAKIEEVAEQAGMQAQIDKSKLDLDKLLEEEEEQNNAFVGVQAQQSDLLEKAWGSVSSRAEKVLPYGEILIDPENMFIGWRKDKDSPARSRNALSGGERVMFDCALAGCMVQDEGVIFVEGSELDYSNLAAMLSHIDKSDPPFQVVLSHWLTDVEAEGNWTGLAL